MILQTGYRWMDHDIWTDMSSLGVYSGRQRCSVSEYEHLSGENELLGF